MLIDRHLGTPNSFNLLHWMINQSLFIYQCILVNYQKSKYLSQRYEKSFLLVYPFRISLAHEDDTNVPVCLRFSFFHHCCSHVLLPIVYDQHLLTISNNSGNVFIVQSATSGSVTTPRPTIANLVGKNRAYVRKKRH